MKLILFGLVAVVAMRGVLSAQASEPQPAWLAKRVTVRFKDARLSDVIAMVLKVTGVRVEMRVPDGELLQARITIDTCGERVENVLKAVLFSTGLSFKVIDDRTVHVFTPATPPEPISTEVCQDPVERVLKQLLGGAPPPLELSPVQAPAPVAP
jgi:hypothetical protein